MKKLPFNHPDKRHSKPNADGDTHFAAANLTNQSPYKPAPTVFDPPEPFPFWLLQKEQDGPECLGTRTMVGSAQLGPIHLDVGDHLELEDEDIEITAIVHWSEPDEVVVELSNGSCVTMEIAALAKQMLDLKYNRACEG